VGDPNAAIVELSGCGSHYLVYSWAFHDGTNSTNIWRANPDGTNPVKLTDGKNDRNPVCSADEKWVYYWNLELQQLWRTPLNAVGKPETLPNSAVPRTFPAGTGLTVAPDGKLAFVLATVPTAEDPYPQYKVALLDVTSATATPQLVDADERISSGGIDFASDGKAVAYPIRESGVDNIWVQPIGGAGGGKQITTFTSEQIFHFRWSPDGKSLALLRGHTDSDVVLIRESTTP
jgi:Tol biopolymer transport system component